MLICCGNGCLRRRPNLAPELNQVAACYGRKTLLTVLSLTLVRHCEGKVRGLTCCNLLDDEKSNGQQGDELKVKVNKLSSARTQLPYDYYSLPFCRPTKIENEAENLGEVLRGDRIETSPYIFKMKKHAACQVVCKIKLDKEGANKFKSKIDDSYAVNMILDNLPVATDMNTYILPGYEIGKKVSERVGEPARYHINNHLQFVVDYHQDPVKNTMRVVGFKVKPNSKKHTYQGEWAQGVELESCNTDKKLYVADDSDPQEIREDEEIIFTYDVTYVPSLVKWASRWDMYLGMQNDQIHWFSIINSLMIVLFLSGMVAMIMLRTLHREISKYNQLETQEEAQEETGWKLVHGDVFRAPNNPGLLCAYVGTGAQILGMTFVTMIFAVLGFLSPANRGSLMSAMLLLWVFMGLIAGYLSARLAKSFKLTEWKSVTLRTAFMYPTFVFLVFFILNCLIWGEASSGAVPFSTMFALVFLWFGISVPLVCIGSYVGFQKPALEDPVRTNKIPRQIPEQAWYMQPFFSVLVGGILPFGAVFIELFFILSSIWLQQFYYIFGFLFLVFIILIVTCAEITIVLCYFQLCSEDYNWWWRAYLTSGSSALYLFLYAAFYFFSRLQITKVVSGILYFGYMLIISYSFFVLTGTAGFYACYWFVRTIYGSVKID
ncbi:hypothetical protein CBR_g36446 [Chara braunii]|uniref:Transmembrane 9 superfamily member n=1 Tax=Chara braunii TaxID=69332 RepID=A0A388LKS5_CHABU|nr:hypothetical protein CBR_g36446 [Chara braunii]|eukprot:GBG82919.1 hypothetical protein CBR_g36446 [Chara braunii]